MTKLTLPLAAVLAVVMTSPVLAVQSGAPQDVRIRYDKSALDQSLARRNLEQRINLAARNVCGEPVTGSKEEADLIRACRTEARAMGMAQVPMLVAARD